MLRLFDAAVIMAYTARTVPRAKYPKSLGSGESMRCKIYTDLSYPVLAKCLKLQAIVNISGIVV